MVWYLSIQTTSDLPSADLLTWADGLVLVYSITDRASFTYLKQVFNHIQVSRSRQININGRYRNVVPNQEIYDKQALSISIKKNNFEHFPLRSLEHYLDNFIKGLNHVVVIHYQNIKLINLV